MKSSVSQMAFVNLSRYFSLVAPTKQQAEEATQILCQMYGAENEEGLFKDASNEIINTYNKLKQKILKAAEFN